MKQGKIAKNRQTELEGIIQHMMRELAMLAPQSRHPDHLGPLFTCAAHHIAQPAGQPMANNLQGVFKNALKRYQGTSIKRKIGLQALISYYLRKLCSLDESALRYELNMAA